MNRSGWTFRPAIGMRGGLRGNDRRYAKVFAEGENLCGRLSNVCREAMGRATRPRSAGGSDPVFLATSTKPLPLRAMVKRDTCTSLEGCNSLKLAGVQGSRTLRAHRRMHANGFEVREVHRDPSTPTHQDTI